MSEKDMERLKELLNKKSIYELLDITNEEKEFIERYYKIKYNFFN